MTRARTRWGLVGSAVGVLAAFLGPVPTAGAATITPTTFDDDNTVNGNCTLREAIRAANNDVAQDACPAGSGPDVITLGPGTYTLSVGPVGDPAAASGDLDITQSLTVQGAGAPITIIDGAGLDRVFETVGLGIVVTMNDLTITGAKGESGTEGGAIFNETALALTRVHITGNESPSNGGAIANQSPDGVLTVTDSAFTDNRADPSSGADGGAIDNSGDAASSLTNVTFSGNVAGGFGGAISNSPGSPMTLNNVTIASNTAGAGTGGRGGGFWTQEPAEVRNTIVAGNSIGPGGGNGPDCDTNATIGSQGHNLIGDPTDCEGVTATDITGASPMGPLADNGGPTPTHALLPGSPAVDRGDPGTPGSGGTSCAATDQRGAPRNCDIGAYEVVGCLGVAVNRVGSGAGDVITGTEGVDAFLAQGGDDIIRGLGGDDVACLGDGNDSADGGAGKDVLSGESGNDRLSGAGGKDVLKGDAGRDTLKGQGGKDRLQGGPGRDTCTGGGGKDKGFSCQKEKKIP